MADLNSLVVFAKVADAGSFSEAARRLNLPVSTVSRRIAELEDQLGVRLLERSTRNLRLTELGAEVLEYAARSAELSETVESIVSNRLSSVSGALETFRAAEHFRHVAHSAGRRLPGLLSERPGSDPGDGPLRRPYRRRDRSHVQARRAKGFVAGRAADPHLSPPAACEPGLPQGSRSAAKAAGSAQSSASGVFAREAGRPMELRSQGEQGQADAHFSALPGHERLFRPRAGASGRRRHSASSRPS